MVKGPNRSTMLIHPDDAAACGLTADGTAKVSAGDRHIMVPVEISDDMMPGTVSIPHGWGHDLPGVSMVVAQAHPGVSPNDVTDDLTLDPLSGNAALSGVRVKVTHAAAP